MKKIGIITHHYINNYGAFLQAYALQKAVSRLYPEGIVEIINYINIKHLLINSAGWFRFNSSKESFRQWSDKIKVPFVFHRARRKFLKSSRLCFTAGNINKLKYDMIIIGSDEVWNYEDKKAHSKVKFGIGLDCQNIISYAPSVGKSCYKSIMPDYVGRGLNKFRHVSARDDATFELASILTLGKVSRVLDPTFLIEFPKIKKRHSEPYILFYYCNNLPNSVMKQIKDYATRNGYYIYGACEAGKFFSSSTININPFNWVGMFQRAEFVFTGTFHGAVFSILYQKPFKVCMTNESRQKKVASLLRELDLEDRILKKGFSFDPEKMRTEIDYNKVNEIVERKRQESMLFLNETLRK